MILHNPNAGDEPGVIRDPHVVRTDGRYYMVGTSPNFWEGRTPGVRMWSSDDLMRWRPEGLMVSADAMPDDAWCKNRFWAPELFVWRGRYYLTFSCRNEAKGTPFGLFLASADRVTGPYRMASFEPFLTGGIDAHLFEADDGSVRLFYADKDIWTARFDPERASLETPPRRVVCRGAEGEWDSIGVEGPALVKRGGRYFLWYSSWTRGYEMGWAVADDPDGEFVKWPANPVISGPGSAFPCAGHNCAFTAADGTDLIAFHGHRPGEPERLCVDRVTYPMESRAPSERIEL